MLDVIDGDADLVVYLNANELRQRRQHAVLLQMFEHVDGGQRLEAQLRETCGFDLLEAPSEVAFAVSMANGKPDLKSAVAALRSNVDLRRTLECLERLVPELAGHVVVREPFLVAGEEGAVRGALARFEAGDRRRPPGDYFHVRYKGFNPIDARELVFAMSRRDGHDELRIDASTRSAEAAVLFRQRVVEMRAAAIARLPAMDLPEAQKQVVLRLLERLSIDHRRSQVSVRVTSNGLADEASLFGALVAVAIYGVRHYVTQAKVAEARSTLGRVAKSLADYASSQKTPRFPASAARVPRQVPAGVKYQSAPSDWQQAGWRDIRFERNIPQYYAYEFETASNGQRAVVRALGDLDGDGVQSRFELELDIEQGRVVVSPNIREQDPLE